MPLLWFLYDSQGRLIRSGELRSLPASLDLFEAGDERGVYFWCVPQLERVYPIVLAP
jgi:hypothetical protein